MNVECQTIRVPDRRPGLPAGALRRHRRRRARASTASARVALDVDPRELEQRIVLAYTGAPRNSGTNNWEIIKRHIDGDRHVFDCFERIRDTAVAMRAALERGDWDEVGRQIAIEWDNRKRLAPGRDDAGDRGPDRAGARRRARRRRRSAAPAAAAASSATARPRARPAIAAALAVGRRAAARLPDRAGRAPRWITPPSRASSAKSPTCSRSRPTTRSRSARTGTAPTSSPTIRTSSRALDAGRAARDPRHRQGPGRAHPRDRRHGRCAVPPRARRGVSADACSTCCTCRASGRRRWRCSTASWTSARSRISQQRPRDGRVRALKGMGAKKEALILKALEERQRHAGRHLLADAHELADGARRVPAGARAGGRHRAGRQPAPRLRDVRRPRHPRLGRARRR